MESIALKAAFLLPLLVLQKHRRSKSKYHVLALECCRKLWHEGSFFELLKEGKAIQKKFCGGSRFNKKSDLANSFTHCMFGYNEQGSA